jgi:uncharacterized membrane protein
MSKLIFGAGTIDRLMPRHAQSYFGLGLGLLSFAITLWLAPVYAVGVGANVLFVTFLAITLFKLPRLTADYLREHAREEDTPAPAILVIVLIVVAASVVSLVLALGTGETPDAAEVILGVASVILGWFTVQALGALHYAYEYYQAPDDGDDAEGIDGGLAFPGDEEPDGVAFMYFSYAIGTSVATSDTKVTTNEMRKRVMLHMVFSHLYNTILLASAVNVILSLGGGG